MHQIVQVVGVVVRMMCGGGGCRAVVVVVVVGRQEERERAASSSRPRIHRPIQSPSRALSLSLRLSLEDEISVLPDGRGCMITPSRSAVPFVLFSATLITLWLVTNPRPAFPTPRPVAYACFPGWALARKGEGEAEKCRGAKCHAASYVKPSSLFTVVTVPRTYIPRTYIQYLLCIRVCRTALSQSSARPIPPSFLELHVRNWSP